MSYSREVIPDEDLNLQSKVSAIQERHLRPIKDEYLSMSDDKSGFELHHSERENLDKTEFSNQNFQKGNSKEISSYNKQLNQEETEIERNLDEQEMINSKEDVVSEEGEKFTISEKDKVRLASDSLDFDELIKPIDKKASSFSETESFKARQSEIRNSINRIVQQKTSVPSATNIDNSQEDTKFKGEMSNDDLTNIQNVENKNFYRKKSDRNVLSKKLEEVPINSYSSNFHQNNNEFKTTSAPEQSFSASAQIFNKEKGYNENIEQKNQKNEALKLFDKRLKFDKIEKKAKKIELNFLNFNKSKEDIEMLFSKATREEKIEFIMSLVISKGADYAIKIAEKTRDWYILDVVHDKLHLVDKK